MSVFMGIFMKVRLEGSARMEKHRHTKKNRNNNKSYIKFKKKKSYQKKNWFYIFWVILYFFSSPPHFPRFFLPPCITLTYFVQSTLAYIQKDDHKKKHGH